MQMKSGSQGGMGSSPELTISSITGSVTKDSPDVYITFRLGDEHAETTVSQPPPLLPHMPTTVAHIAISAAVQLVCPHVLERHGQESACEGVPARRDLLKWHMLGDAPLAVNFWSLR